MSLPTQESSVVLTPFPPTLYNSRRDDRGRLDSRTRFVFHVSGGVIMVLRGSWRGRKAPSTVAKEDIEPPRPPAFSATPRAWPEPDGPKQHSTTILWPEGPYVAPYRSHWPRARGGETLDAEQASRTCRRLAAVSRSLQDAAWGRFAKRHSLHCLCTWAACVPHPHAQRLLPSPTRLPPC